MNEIVKSQSAVVEIEQSRAIQEAQAAMVIAKKFPRDRDAAVERIKAECSRIDLAKEAMFGYPRGKTMVEGATIRLAEALAQNWGNIKFGIRELSQSDGVSEVEAFAWDLETNVTQIKTFEVPHVRYTKSGKYKLKDPRDIYELVANMGARRLRACILGIIPGDIQDMAKSECEKTLYKEGGDLKKRIKSMTGKFKEIGVSVDLIEKRVLHNIDSTTSSEIVELGKIYNSINTGMSKPSDWFEISEPIDIDAQKLTEKIKNQQEEIDYNVELTRIESEDIDGFNDALKACDFSNRPVTKTALKQVFEKYMKGK